MAGAIGKEWTCGLVGGWLKGTAELTTKKVLVSLVLSLDQFGLRNHGSKKHVERSSSEMVQLLMLLLVCMASTTWQACKHCEQKHWGFLLTTNPLCKVLTKCRPPANSSSSCDIAPSHAACKQAQLVSAGQRPHVFQLLPETLSLHAMPTSRLAPSSPGSKRISNGLITSWAQSKPHLTACETPARLGNAGKVGVSKLKALHKFSKRQLMCNTPYKSSFLSLLQHPGEVQPFGAELISI